MEYSRINNLLSLLSFFPTQKSGWRNELGNEKSSELLEEIQILNLQFPVHRFFTLLLRKITAPKEDISALSRKLNMFLKTNNCSQRNLSILT